MKEGQVVRLYLPEEKLILVNGNSSDGSSS